MKKLAVVCLLFFVAFNSEAQYENDVTSIENIGKAYYEIVSGPIGEKRDFNRLRNLFHPKATLTYSYYSKEEKKNKLMHMDIEGYIGKLDYLDKKGFYEKELYVSSETYGSITQSISTYKFWMEDKTAEGKGFTSYQYFWDGKRYWILSMFWMMESDQYPIPKKYLKE
ncbi:hypothetical protein AAON49_07560 [Pseudotenacibaculum sp. MALMAid0570]|uniref:hypothetical protein n=1 Tax=Pseudotenacibaculum sp. MALMAid0570 TaxID=3143938 RepID=UPI0032DEECA7